MNSSQMQNRSKYCIESKVGSLSRLGLSVCLGGNRVLSREFHTLIVLDHNDIVLDLGNIPISRSLSSLSAYTGQYRR